MDPRYVREMKLKPVMFGVIVGAVVAASVTAWATIPDSNTGAVTACSNKYGYIRLIDGQAGKKCKRTEKKLTLGARGLTGPLGYTGPMGPEGATGPAGGPAGATGATGPAGGAPQVLVKDANGVTVGTFIGVTEERYSLIVLGADGHFRQYDISSGAYAYRPFGRQTHTTTDCTGDFYVYPGNEGMNPFGMISRHLVSDAGGNTTGTVYLIESDTVFVDSSQIRSVGAPGECSPITNPAGTPHYKFVTPAFSIGADLTGPLKIVPAP